MEARGFDAPAAIEVANDILNAQGELANSDVATDGLSVPVGRASSTPALHSKPTVERGVVIRAVLDLGDSGAILAVMRRRFRLLGGVPMWSSTGSDQGTLV